MKITKGDIIFYGICTIIIGVFVWGVVNSVSTSNYKYSICAEEYGYDLKTGWEWEGISSLNYTYEPFNETHLVCCIKGKFLNSNGEIQHSNCTKLLKIGEKRT